MSEDDDAIEDMPDFKEMESGSSSSEEDNGDSKSQKTGVKRARIEVEYEDVGNDARLRI